MAIKNKEKLSSGILSLLPLFYVGWSDSVLSPTEIKLIHRKINDFTFLTKKEKEYLIQWTDPTNGPPDELTFKYWLQEIKAAAVNMDDSKKHNLVDLGIEIAKSGTTVREDKVWNSPNTKKALEEVENALGIDNAQSAHLLLQQLFQENQSYRSVLASFDAESMKIFLDKDYYELKQKMRKLLRDPIFKRVEIRDKDLYRLRVLNQVKELANQGVSAYSFPKKYGGFEKKGDHLVVFEMLAYHDLSLTIKFGVQFGLFGGAIFMLGSEKHHRKYLEAMSKAELLGCFAMTETNHGSNVKGLETTAVYNHDSGSITIHTPYEQSGKEYIGNALHSTMAAVFAQLYVGGINHGVHAILVPLRDADGNLLQGIRVEDNGYKLGLNGVDNGRIWFDNVVVPKDNLLDKYGQILENGEYISPISNPSKRFFTMLGALVVGRISVGLAGVSAAKSALTIAIKYGSKRRQFGANDEAAETVILDYPTHQSRLFPKIAKTYAYYFALRRLADKYVNNTDGDMRHIETLAAGLKSKATWHATETIQECREACGGKGYLVENGFANLKADSDIFTTFEGDNTVLMQLVAKGVLTGFKASFHEEGFRAVIKYVYGRVQNTLSEINPYYARNTNTDYLLSSEFHLHAFHYREQKLLYSLSTRMRDYLQKRIDPYQAFLKCQLHMVELAHAYIDHITLKSFIKEIKTCEDLTIKSALTKQCQLFALDNIDQNKGWFLENDYMEGSKTKAIRRVMGKLLQEIRPDAEVLVEAFGIPDELLASEIIKA